MSNPPVNLTEVDELLNVLDNLWTFLEKLGWTICTTTKSTSGIFYKDPESGKTWETRKSLLETVLQRPYLLKRFHKEFPAAKKILRQKNSKNRKSNEGSEECFWKPSTPDSTESSERTQPHPTLTETENMCFASNSPKLDTQATKTKHSRYNNVNADERGGVTPLRLTRRSPIQSTEDSDGYRASLAWLTLRKEGWTHASGNHNVTYCFLKPGVKKSSGIHGQTLFMGYSELWKYVKQHRPDLIEDNYNS